MKPASIFQLQLALGYVPWLLCFGAYVWPTLRTMEPAEAHRAIATLHSFRFFGLVFIVPGVVGHDLPSGFATFAAYGDFATALLAMLALATAAGHAGARHFQETSCLLAVRGRIQYRGSDRPHRQLLPRRSRRPSSVRG